MKTPISNKRRHFIEPPGQLALPFPEQLKYRAGITEQQLEFKKPATKRWQDHKAVLTQSADILNIEVHRRETPTIKGLIDNLSAMRLPAVLADVVAKSQNEVSRIQ